jgi:hypothetical protein
MRWYQRLFRRARTEKRLDQELRFHLEQQIADYIATGMTPEEARRRARLEFGGLDQVKEECRDSDPGHSLRLAPIAPQSGLYSRCRADALPYPHPKQLIAVWLTAPGINIKDMNPSPSIYFTFRVLYPGAPGFAGRSDGGASI